MIRKLFAGTAVLAIAVVAVMLLSLGGSTKSAEAVVHDIALVDGSSIPVGSTNFDVEINADEFNSGDQRDIFVMVSNGPAIGDDCEYADGDPCDFHEVNSTQAIINCDGEDCDELNLEFDIAPGFTGGSVMITACQNDDPENFDDDAWPFISCRDNTAFTRTFQVVGAVTDIELHALRDYTNDGVVNQCTGIPVYVIAALGYTQGAYATTFDNDRAVLCAELTDSAGHPVPGEAVAWSDSGPGCVDNDTTFTLNNGVTHNTFYACGTGDSGEVSTVSACVGSVCGTIDIEFGDDPASCSIPIPDTLDIGDVHSFVATFVDEFGNKVPDGIIAHVFEVDSGDGGDNVDVISVIEDTVNSQVTGSIVAAISGLTTFGVALETVGGADVSCAEALELSGDVHVHPDDCDDEDGILYGNQPPAGGGFGTFAYCGGSWDGLLEASGCPAATSVFFYNDPSGGFEVWIPGSDVAAVNAEILARWPDTHHPIPEGTIFTAKCK